MALPRYILLNTVGYGTWTVPSDWRNANAQVIAIGGGGGGMYPTFPNIKGGQGGSAALANTTYMSLTPGQTVYYYIGAGGAAGAAGVANGAGVTGSGGTGSATWFNWTANANPSFPQDGIRAAGGLGGGQSGAGSSVGYSTAGGAGGTGSGQHGSGAGGGAAGHIGSSGGAGGASAPTIGSGGGGGGGYAGDGAGSANTGGSAGGAGGTASNGGGGGNGGAGSVTAGVNAGGGGAGGAGAQYSITAGGTAGFGGGGGGGGGGGAFNGVYGGPGGSGGLYGGGGGSGGMSQDTAIAEGAGAAGAQGAIIIAVYNIPQTFYWVGGDGTWSDAAHWSLSSGGAGGAGVPTEIDDVVFNSASSAAAYTVSILAAAYINNITIQAPASGAVTIGGSTNVLYINGSFSAVASTVWNSVQPYFQASSTGKTITTNNINFNCNSVTFNGNGGGWSLVGNLNSYNATLTIYGGSLNANGYAISVFKLYLYNTYTATLSLGSATHYISHTFLKMSTAATLSAGTSTISMDQPYPTIGTTSGNVAFNNVTMTVATTGSQRPIDSSNNVFHIAGNTAINGLTVSAPFAAGYSVLMLSTGNTVNVATMVMSGLNGTRRWFVRGTDLSGYPGPTTLNINTWASRADVDFHTITIGGTIGTVSGTRIGDCGTNVNVVGSTPKTVYYRSTTVGDTWYSGTGWANSSGGAVASNNYPLPQDTAIIDDTSVNSLVYVNPAILSGIDARSRTQPFTLQLTDVGCLWCGDIHVSNAITWDASYGLNVSPTMRLGSGNGSSRVLTTANVNFPYNLIIDTVGAALTVNGQLIIPSTTASNNAGLILTGGSLTITTHNVTVPFVRIIGDVGKLTGIDMGTGTWTVGGYSNTANCWTMTPVLAFKPNTSTIVVTSNVDTTFAGGGMTYNNVLLAGTGNVVTISGNNTYNNLSCNSAPKFIKFGGGSTQTFNNFNLSGSELAKQTSITTISGTTRYNLVKSSGNVDVVFANISYANASGGATWMAVSSVDGANNTGWAFRTPTEILSLF